MSENVTTLAGLLAPDGEAAERLLEAAGKDEGIAAATRRALAPVLPVVAGEVGERLREVLDVPVPVLLAGAWARYVELLKFRDPERYPPAKVSVVELASHTVKSRHRPSLEVEVGGVLPAPVTLRMELDVELVAKVEGARIAVQAGKIRKLLGGALDLRATLVYRGQKIATAARKVALPGELPLGDGIPISPAIAVGHELRIATGPATVPPDASPAAAEGDAPV